MRVQNNTPRHWACWRVPSKVRYFSHIFRKLGDAKYGQIARVHGSGKSGDEAMTTPDIRRNLGMAWRRRVTIFWNAWLTLITLGRQ